MSRFDFGKKFLGILGGRKGTIEHGIDADWEIRRQIAIAFRILLEAMLRLVKFEVAPKRFSNQFDVLSKVVPPTQNESWQLKPARSPFPEGPKQFALFPGIAKIALALRPIADSVAVSEASLSVYVPFSAVDAFWTSAAG